MLSVQSVAEFIIQESERVSNLKLQKLLYYVQGWHLGIKGSPLYNGRLEAWVHGPVVPEMFQLYRVHRWQTIPKPDSRVILTATEEIHIKSVLKVYGKYAADQLERMSHETKPWIDARGGVPEHTLSSSLISNESMRVYFAERAKAKA